MKKKIFLTLEIILRLIIALAFVGYILYGIFDGIYEFITTCKKYPIVLTVFSLFLVLTLVIIILVHYLKKDKLLDEDIAREITPRSAEVIVNAFGKSLSMPLDNDIGIRPNSLLKNSKEEIKNAFKVYIRELKRQKRLNNKIKHELVVTYSFIDSFVDDVELDKYLKIYKDVKDGIRPKSERSIILELLENINSKRLSSLTEAEKLFLNSNI